MPFYIIYIFIKKQKFIFKYSYDVYIRTYCHEILNFTWNLHVLRASNTKVKAKRVAEDSLIALFLKMLRVPFFFHLKKKKPDYNNNVVCEYGGFIAVLSIFLNARKERRIDVFVVSLFLTLQPPSL